MLYFLYNILDLIHEARSQTRRQLDRFILPKALVNRLNLQQRQRLHVSELPDGGVRLSPYDPAFLTPR